ncbi:MAG: SUMF1/EgtB/PvdO family nonheme iron enzyme [Chloroflexi bacterium]|nr:SUMF1/EgtB/PvdO family nonheme iron enzyme [Chloroflexota bacterium]
MPIRLKRAAICGALDMSGNLWEWCLNKHEPSEFTKVDDTGKYRVMRGGSFRHPQGVAACAVSSYGHPDFGDSGCGVRVVVAAPI